MKKYPDLVATMMAFTDSDQVVLIYKPLVAFAGSLEGGIMLCQLLYWTPRATIPDGWIAKSDAEFADELCLTVYAIRKEREMLEGMGILETVVRKFNGTPKVHYRLKMDTLHERWTHWISCSEFASPKPKPADIEIDSLDTEADSSDTETYSLYPESPSSTENTTENTTEIARAAPDESPKRSKEAKQKRPTPSAVLVFRENAHRYPAKSWWGDLAAQVSDDPLELDRWGKTVKLWVGLGWNPTNVAGMLDCFDKHELPGDKHKVGQQSQEPLRTYT